MDENDAQEKINFLLDTTFNHLPEHYIKFRSYLNLYSSEIARNYGLKLPKYFTNKNVSCPFCLTPWQFKTNSFKLFPSSGKKFKCDDKIKSSENENEQFFSKKNKLVLKCNVCTRKTGFSLIKPVTKNKEVSSATVENNSQKKKKKRKNKCVNLSVQACLSAGMIPKGKRRKKERKKKNSGGCVSTEKQSTDTKIENNSSKNKLRNPFATSRTVKESEKIPATNKLKNVKLLPNPNAIQLKEEILKRKKLATLKQAIKKDKVAPMSGTLRDFLTVVPR